MGQFNKQNPAQWLNNLAMVKSRGAIRGSGGAGGMMTGHSQMIGNPPNRSGNSQMMMMKGGPPSGHGHMDGGFPGGNCNVMDSLPNDPDIPWDVSI